MHLPDSVYESLPIIYILIGLAVMFFLEGTLAVISGGLLMVAGAIIFSMRRRNRLAIAAMDRKQKRRRR